MYRGMGMPKIIILPDAVSGDIQTGTPLLQCAERLGIELLHSCGGVAACTSCRVVIRQGNENLSPIKQVEAEVLAESGILRSHRLACQARIFGDVTFERPVWTAKQDVSLNGV
jgi:ferredoxin, 2Fe-2S